MRKKAIKNKQREYIIRRFRGKLKRQGTSIAEFARSRGIKETVFYVRLYDRERGLNGAVRDAVIDYIREE